ncbi:MAG: DUF4058 family protein [Planctomycetaceae bacterium]
MPLHDWTTVVAGTFHDFHYIWVAEIRRRLNSGLLPDGYYAQAEQVTGAAVPDVLTLQDESGSADVGSADSVVPPKSAIALLDSPPQVQLTQSAEERLYARKRDRVAVRHRSGDRTVALIDVVSPGNKHSVAELRRFLEKIDSALEAGVHCLVIDVHPPGSARRSGPALRSGIMHSVNLNKLWRHHEQPWHPTEQTSTGSQPPMCSRST